MSLRARITTPESLARNGAASPADGTSHLVAVYRAKLLEEIDLAEMSAPRRRRAPGPPGARTRATSSAARAPSCPPASARQLIRRVVDEALGLGILEPLLEDASITEIMVNGPDQIFVERGGRVEQLPLRFASERAADADHRAHRLDRQPPGGRVQSDGRRPPALRRARQRHHPAAVAHRPHPHHPPLPPRLHAARADRPRLARRAHADAARRRSSAPGSTSSSPAAPAPARRPCSTRCPG